MTSKGDCVIIVLLGRRWGGDEGREEDEETERDA
jgi:hypothetical protein